MKTEKLIEILQKFPLEFEIEIAVSNNKYIAIIPIHPNELDSEDGVLIGNLKSKQQLLQELEILNSVTPEAFENPNGNQEIITNPNGNIQMLEVPRSLNDYYTAMETYNKSDKRTNYKVCLISKFLVTENIARIKNFQSFMKKYNHEILNKEIIIPCFVEEELVPDDLEIVSLSKDSKLQVTIGIKNNKDKLQDFVDIYKQYFEQFPNQKVFKFDENLEIGIINFEELND